MGRLLDYLKASIGAWPPNRTPGTESDWLSIGDLRISSGMLWIGDPMVIGKDFGSTFEVPKGFYHVEGKGMDFSGHRRVSRVRVFLDGTDSFSLKENTEIDIDMGLAVICDIGLLESARIEIEEPKFSVQVSHLLLKSKCRIAQFPLKTLSCDFAFTETGFGDGSSRIFALLQNDSIIGIEAEFLAPHCLPPELG
jgi:hypothetical protein